MMKYFMIGMLATLFAFVFAGSSTLHAESFFDDFEDGNLKDGDPVTWLGTDIDNGGASVVNGDMLLDPKFGVTDGYIDPYVILPTFSDNTVELTVEFMTTNSAAFFGVDPREPLDGLGNGYWAGVLGSGELAIGYSIGPNASISRRGVFLPGGPIQQGTVLEMQVAAIENTISINVLRVGSDPVESAYLEWTDSNNRYPTGGLFSPFLNPLGTLDAVVIHDIKATYSIVPEPTSTPILLLIGTIAGTMRRRRREISATSVMNENV